VATRQPPLTLRPLLIPAVVTTPVNRPRIRNSLQGRGMRTLEIKMKLTPPNLFERFAGMGFAYETTITDGEIEVIGRGPTPESLPRSCAHAVGICAGCKRGGDVPIARRSRRRLEGRKSRQIGTEPALDGEGCKPAPQPKHRGKLLTSWTNAMSALGH